MSRSADATHVFAVQTVRRHPATSSTDAGAAGAGARRGLPTTVAAAGPFETMAPVRRRVQRRNIASEVEQEDKYEVAMG
jgi:hypothetical protein